MSTTKEGTIQGLEQHTTPTAATATPSSTVVPSIGSVTVTPKASTVAAASARSSVATNREDDDIRGLPPKKPAAKPVAQTAGSLSSHSGTPIPPTVATPSASAGKNLVDARGLDKKEKDEDELVKLATLLGEDPTAFIASQRAAFVSAKTTQPPSALSRAAADLAASYSGPSLLGDDDFSFVGDDDEGNDWEGDDSDPDLSGLPSLGHAKPSKSALPATAALASGSRSGGAGPVNVPLAAAGEADAAAIAALNALSTASLMGGGLANANASANANVPLSVPANAPLSASSLSSSPATVVGDKPEKREKVTAPAPKVVPNPAPNPAATASASRPALANDELLEKTRKMYALLIKKPFFTSASADQQNILKRRITTEISLYLKDPSKYPVKSPMEDLLNCDIREAGAIINAPVAIPGATAAAASMHGSRSATAVSNSEMTAIYGGEDPQLFELRQRLALEQIRNANAHRSTPATTASAGGRYGRDADEKYADERNRMKQSTRTEVDELADILGEKPQGLAQDPARVQKISVMAESVCKNYGSKHKALMQHQTSEMILAFEKNVTREVNKYLKSPATYPVLANDPLNVIMHEVGKSLGFAAMAAPSLSAPLTAASDINALSALNALNAVSLMGGAGPSVVVTTAANRATAAIASPIASASSSRMDEKEDIQALAAACGMTPAELIQQRDLERAHSQRQAMGAAGRLGGASLGNEFALRQAQLLRQSLASDAEPSLYGDGPGLSAGLLPGYGSLSGSSAGASNAAATGDSEIRRRMATAKQLYDYIVATGAMAQFDRPGIKLLGEKILQEIADKTAKALMPLGPLKEWSRPDLSTWGTTSRNKVKVNSKDEINLLIAQMAGVVPVGGTALMQTAMIHSQAELSTQMESEAVIELLNAYRTGIVTYQPSNDGVDPSLEMGVKAILVGYLIGPYQLVGAGGRYEDYNAIKDVQDLLMTVPASALKF
jgi:hypothetical protein